MSTFNPGSGPYNYPQVTINAPLSPPPAVFTNLPTLLQGNLAAVHLFLNGLRLTDGADYTRTADVFTMSVAPATGDTLAASVYPIGLQLGGPSPQRYIAPWAVPVTGTPNGTNVTFFLMQGQTISGALDGVNKLFTIGVVLSRMEVFRNGLVQTQNVDVSFAPAAVVFMPGNIPEAGDQLMIVGW